MITRERLIECMERTDGLPIRRGHREHRTIYETGEGANLKPSGRFCIDYASFSHGTTEEVPRILIDQLEIEGVIVRAFPDAPHVNGWILKRGRRERPISPPERQEQP